MRIMMTTDTVGGVWTFTSELTQGLLDSGHEVSLLSLGRLPDEAQTQWTQELTQRFPTHFRYTASDAPLEWMDENARCWDESAAALSRCLRDFDAEVIHSNQFVFGQLNAGLPILITAHSDILSWAEACQPEGLLLTPWLDTCLKLTREGIVGADTLIAPTHWMADTITSFYGWRFAPCVIPNGRDLSPAKQERKLQAVTAGRLYDPAKGTDLLAQLNSPIPILVAGELSNNPAEQATLPHIRAVGHVSPDELAELFASSSLYLATSRYEPFGLAPLEAALCGCAILARDIPSLREVWADAALYFNDAPSLERLLHHLADTPAALAQAQCRSLTQARRYTRAAMTEAYLAAYDELLMRYDTPPYDYQPEPARAF